MIKLFFLSVRHKIKVLCLFLYSQQSLKLLFYSLFTISSVFKYNSSDMAVVAKVGFSFKDIDNTLKTEKMMLDVLKR